jgi:putative holliday junction resolvase
MRVLALDHGTVRIGVALSDELKMMAHPLEFIPAEPFNGFVDRLKQLIREKEVEQIVVGMPRNMDGSYGPSAEKVRQFIIVLKEIITIPIRSWDERLTSVQANRLMAERGVKTKDKREKVDKMAAALLLQNYLDAIGGNV